MEPARVGARRRRSVRAVRFAIAVARTPAAHSIHCPRPGATSVSTPTHTRSRCGVLTIDLGAVAKGLAVDAAARELQPFRDFAIDAGGDLYLGGRNPDGAPWSVGVRHPRADGGLLDTFRVSDAAVFTSGDYERPAHIVDPRSGASPGAVASVTVVAPGAMLADALGTAAFVLGPPEGLRLLERHGVEGLIVTTALERFETRGLPRS